MCLLWVANFRGLVLGFARLPTLSWAFTIGHICITKNIKAFTRNGVYPYLLLPDTYFHFHVYNRATLLDVVLMYRAHYQTPNTVLIVAMHSHPFNAMSLCINNAMRHCMFYHATCMINATWTTLSTPLTGCHGPSHHLHMTSIHHFIHVNISCTHISTSIYNMPFYVQPMTQTQSSHVMAICTYQFITCRYIRTYILTSKHVTT